MRFVRELLPISGMMAAWSGWKSCRLLKVVQNTREIQFAINVRRFKDGGHRDSPTLL